MSNETENERIDINAIEKEWTDLVNSKKFKMNEFAYNVQPMIAELKRCYEEIYEDKLIEEALWNALDNWDICMDDYSMHDLYNNLDEKYARDYEGRIILKELYSYTEEDGWYQEEPASE